MSKWDPEPFKVKSIKGSMVTGQRNGANDLTRNSSHFKHYHGDVDPDEIIQPAVPETIRPTMPIPGEGSNTGSSTPKFTSPMADPERTNGPTARGPGRPTGTTKAATKASTEAKAMAYQEQRLTSESTRVQPARGCKQPVIL